MIGMMGDGRRGEIVKEIITTVIIRQSLLRGNSIGLALTFATRLYTSSEPYLSKG